MTGGGARRRPPRAGLVADGRARPAPAAGQRAAGVGRRRDRAVRSARRGRGAAPRRPRPPRRAPRRAPLRAREVPAPRRPLRRRVRPRLPARRPPAGPAAGGPTPADPAAPATARRRARSARRPASATRSTGPTLDDLRVLAEEAVERHGGFDEGVRTERYHVYRVLRAIDLARLLHDAIRRARERGDAVDRADVSARVEALRRLVTEQVRARLAGRAHPGGRRLGALDVDIVHALGRAARRNARGRPPPRAPAGGPAAPPPPERAHGPGRHASNRPPLGRHRRRAARRRLPAAPSPQARAVLAVRRLGLGRRLRRIHAHADLGPRRRAGRNPHFAFVDAVDEITELVDRPRRPSSRGRSSSVAGSSAPTATRTTEPCSPSSGTATGGPA